MPKKQNTEDLCNLPGNLLLQLTLVLHQTDRGSTMHSLGNWSFHNVVIDLSSGQRPNISVAGEDSIDAVLPNSLGKNDFTTAFGVRFVEFSGGD